MPPHLKAECSRCAALCCHAFEMTVEQGFPIDKPANVRCSQLGDDGRCSIHERRHLLGFGPCATYDCYGAGQWATQRFCTGRAAGSETIDAAMLDAFRTVAAIHELLAILTLARLRVSTAPHREALQACERSMLELREECAAPSVRRRVAAEKERVLGILRAQPAPSLSLPR